MSPSVWSHGLYGEHRGQGCSRAVEDDRQEPPGGRREGGQRSQAAAARWVTRRTMATATTNDHNSKYINTFSLNLRNITVKLESQTIFDLIYLIPCNKKEIVFTQKCQLQIKVKI